MKSAHAKMTKDLDEIYKQITKGQDVLNLSRVERRFWKIVGQIKRIPNPDAVVVNKASKIRDLLYSKKFGGSIPLWISLPICFALAAICEYIFFYAVIFDLQGGIAEYEYWSIWWTMCFLYPFGRFISGKFTGIKLDSFVISPLVFPTLKVNYSSYLRALPPKRKWFFLFTGSWTSITAGILGVIRYIGTMNMFSFHPVIILAIIEIIASTGIFDKWGGELNNYHREKRIVRDWSKLVASNKK